MMYLQTLLMEIATVPCLSPFSGGKSFRYNSRLLAWRSVQTSFWRLSLAGEMLSDNNNDQERGILIALIRRVYVILNVAKVS